MPIHIVPARAQDTLKRFLTSTVTRNSLLLTGAHAGYHDLEFYGSSYERCNHSNGHVGLTNQIENPWGIVKHSHKKLYSCVPTRKLNRLRHEWTAQQN